MATSPATGKTGTLTIPYGQPANEAQWADDFLDYIGAPATKANLTFITAAELFEDTFHANPDFIPRKYGDDNRYNPLDSTQFEAGGVVWAENSGDPVWQFPTLLAGLESNAAVIEENPGDQGLLEDLRKGTKGPAELAADVGASDWGTGGGPGSPAEMGYSVDLADELQEALADVQSGLGAGKWYPPTPATATLTSASQPFPGGVWDPLNAPEEITGAIVGAVGKYFIGDLKAAWPYALMIVGVIGGIGLFVLGAKQAATSRRSESGGGIVDLVQQHPELAAVGA